MPVRKLALAVNESVNPCETSPAMDWHPIWGVFSCLVPSSWDKFHIHQNPDQDKVVIEGE